MSTYADSFRPARWHPDQDSSAFNPRTAWCSRCMRTIRLVGTRYYLGTNPDAVYCSQVCADADSDLIEDEENEA